MEEDTNKKNKNDFVLWFTKSKFEDQALKWDSPWGVGYPGWHIECSGISMKYNGEYLDLHCGGIDNAFPHHTNEIAQSESYLGHPWCPQWFHVHHLNTSDGKMSKSKGEFLTVSLLEQKGYDPLAYRYFCLQSHYRKALVFSWENLDNAAAAYSKLIAKIAALDPADGSVNSAVLQEYKDKFIQQVGNDLNTSMGVTALYDALKAKANDATKLAILDSFDTVLSLSLLKRAASVREANAKAQSAKAEGGYTVTGEGDPAIDALVLQRYEAKKTKNFAEADRIRDELKAQGYKMNDTVGLTGVEAAFEQYLRGTDGKQMISVNSDGKITGEYYSVEPRSGYTVELTIDLDLQQSVEDALASAVESLNAKDGLDSRGAAAAVVKVGTGEILSLASYPTFDLSTWRQDYAELSSDPATPMLNRAASSAYAPGSTLKPATAVAALESGATTPSETLFDTGYWKYPSTTWNGGTWCWKHSGHGKVNATTAITNSCNYYFAEMGYRMGLDTLNEYYSALGLGEPTGIEIGEKTGRQATNEGGSNQAPWAAYGQADQLYTPLQLANYIATLVSGGQHCPAHLLKSVKSYDNSEIIATGDTTPLNTLSISDSTLQAVKKGMYGYTQPGGMVYSYFKDCIVSAGAKTGTAQLGGGLKNNGVFVAFAPYDDPEIAIALVLEKGDAGAALASTAVTILNSYFSRESTGSILSDNELIP